MSRPPSIQEDDTSSAVGTTDVLLLSCPTKNVDYPGLALPILAGSLQTNGLKVLALDLNAEMRHSLMSGSRISELCENLLPLLSRSLFSNSNMQAKCMLLVNWIKCLRDQGISVEDIASAREQMLARQYQELLSSPKGFDACLSVFYVSRCLHYLFYLYVTNPKVLKIAGFDDPIDQDILRIMNIIARSRPSLIGLSVMDIQRPFSMYVAARIREHFNIPIVIGGPDPTKFAPAYLRSYPQIDYVLIREAEETLPSLAQFISSRRDLVKYIPNLYYREGGNICHSHQRSQAPEHAVKPDYSVLPLRLYLIPALPIQASRGCVWAKCNFCVHWQTYSQRVERPASDVADDILSARNSFGIRLFHFTDDELPLKLGSEIAKRLETTCPDVKWLSYARSEESFNRDVFELWHSGGCRILEWGFESASQCLLDRMNKGTQIPIMLNNIKDSSSAGILNKLFAFHGYPGETDSELEATLDVLSDLAFSRQIRLFFPIRNRFELLSGARIFDDMLANPNIYGMIRRPRGRFSIRGEMPLNPSDYERKLAMIKTFSENMALLQSQRRVYFTDDENVTLDLQVIDLIESGITPTYSPIGIREREPGA